METNKELEKNIAERTFFMQVEKDDIQNIIDAYDSEYQCSDEMIDEIFKWIKYDYDGRAGDNYYKTLGEDIIEEFGCKIQNIPDNI
jgi:hypothetical protein